MNVHTPVVLNECNGVTQRRFVGDSAASSPDDRFESALAGNGDPVAETKEDGGGAIVVVVAVDDVALAVGVANSAATFAFLLQLIVSGAI